jgi:hypothetical protein
LSMARFGAFNANCVAGALCRLPSHFLRIFLKSIN